MFPSAPGVEEPQNEEKHKNVESEVKRKGKAKQRKKRKERRERKKRKKEEKEKRNKRKKEERRDRKKRKFLRRPGFELWTLPL